MGDKYDLQVNLIIPKRTFRGVTLEGLQAGEMLQGEIQLRSHQDIECRGVWLEIGYWDRGNGTPNENRLYESKIIEGRLQRNVTKTHLIQFTLPAYSPVSYMGQAVKIEWFVRIRIDIPLWFDKREEFPFRVIPGIVESRNEIDFELFRSRSNLDVSKAFKNILSGGLNNRE